MSKYFSKKYSIFIKKKNSSIMFLTFTLFFPPFSPMKNGVSSMDTLTPLLVTLIGDTTGATQVTMKRATT